MWSDEVLHGCFKNGVLPLVSGRTNGELMSNTDERGEASVGMEYSLGSSQLTHSTSLTGAQISRQRISDLEETSWLGTTSAVSVGST